MSSYNLHNAELLIARFNDARATALEVAGQLPAAHDEIRALRASLRAMRADLEQSVSRHKMCQHTTLGDAQALIVLAQDVKDRIYAAAHEAGMEPAEWLEAVLENLEGRKA